MDWIGSIGISLIDWFVWRSDLAGNVDLPPDLTDYAQWFERKLYPPSHKSPNTAIHSKTNARNVQTAKDKVGLKTTKATHKDRKYAGVQARQNGASTEGLMSMGDWQSSVGQQVYLAQIPFWKDLLPLGGLSEGQVYNLPREKVRNKTFEQSCEKLRFAFLEDNQLFDNVTTRVSRPTFEFLIVKGLQADPALIAVLQSVARDLHQKQELLHLRSTVSEQRQLLNDQTKLLISQGEVLFELRNRIVDANTKTPAPTNPFSTPTKPSTSVHPSDKPVSPSTSPPTIPTMSPPRANVPTSHGSNATPIAKVSSTTIPASKPAEVAAKSQTLPDWCIHSISELQDSAGFYCAYENGPFTGDRNMPSPKVLIMNTIGNFIDERTASGLRSLESVCSILDAGNKNASHLRLSPEKKIYERGDDKMDKADPGGAAKAQKIAESELKSVQSIPARGFDLEKATEIQQQKALRASVYLPW
ncbi:hypothetical protein BDR26DRAFT_937902 [Obelidium mucronatum]|nr:hypothetical protein BDR26DRAFT_937902 [Obelidium mucronatum]